jgi:single-stranded DNA-binding protein
VANDVQFLDTRGGGEGGGGAYERGTSSRPSSPTASGEETPPMEESHARDVDPDDIPF